VLRAVKNLRLIYTLWGNERLARPFFIARRASSRFYDGVAGGVHWRGGVEAGSRRRGVERFLRRAKLAPRSAAR